MIQQLRRHWFGVLLLTCIGIHITSLFNGIMEVDAMLYATIAKHMALTNDWINLFGDGHDWLDKPHLPFWLEALSFKLFGISDAAYKLPGFLCLLGALYYCYQFARRLYNQQVAQLSTIILATSLHLFLAVFDLRAEAFLAFFVIAATFHCYRTLPAKWSWHILWAALYCAAAVMTKGIFVLVTIGSGLLLYWVYSKQWLAFLQPKWWVLLLLTLLFITPEIYCLYVQFDQHPEKVVFGTTHVSGVKFFFWDSQFGRFFNSGPIKGNGDPFFFVHTFLWAFLPWSLVAYAGLFVTTKKLTASSSPLLLLSGAAVVTFLLFSLSKFQLPHYIVMVFPHFAILSAVYLHSLQKASSIRWWNAVMIFLLAVAAVLVLLLAFVTRFVPVIVPLLLTALVVLLVVLFCRKNSLLHLTGKAVCFALMLYVYMNGCFYPYLLRYQGGAAAARYLNEDSRARYAIMYQCNYHSFQWYANADVLPVSQLTDVPQRMKQQDSLIVLVTPDKLATLRSEVSTVTELRRFDNFHVSQLTLPFLQQDSRQEQLGTLILTVCKLK